MDKLLITVAPCVPPYIALDRPDLDLSPRGIAQEVVRAWEAGANVAHLHVWDDSGQPTQSLDAFVLTIDLIRERCDIIIEGSTGGINDLSPRERSVSLDADIELASLNPGSVNYDDTVYVNSPADIAYWVGAMSRRGILPDAAIFEAGMIENVAGWVEQGLISRPTLYSLVLGVRGALPATAKHLYWLADLLPDDALWCAVPHGDPALMVQLSAMAMAMGGHVRAGFEDSLYIRQGELAISNAQQVERLVRIGREMGREPASPSDARAMLGLALR